MSIYICPFCKSETEDGILNLIEHRKPGGECDTKLENQNPERGPMKTHKFARKTFYVDAVRVSEANLEEVAQWCSGTVKTDETGHSFLSVEVHRPLTERQTQAYIGDWVLFAGSGYKVYTPKAFDKSFEKVKTLTKEQADAAGITVPHEPRPKSEKKAPVPTPPRRKHKAISDLGKALKEAQAAVKDEQTSQAEFAKAKELEEAQAQIPDDVPVVETATDVKGLVDTGEVQPENVSLPAVNNDEPAILTSNDEEPKSKADLEAQRLIDELRSLSAE